MKIKNVLKLLRKADENTLSEIHDNYSADWEMNELFEKSYEKYLSESNIKEDTDESITVEYLAEKSSSAVYLTVHRIIPAAACFALIAVSVRFISTHSSDNKTENPDVYNNSINTTSEKITEGSSITSGFTDIYTTTTPEEKITEVYTVTEYDGHSSEAVGNTEKITSSVTSFTQNESVKYSNTTHPVTSVTTVNTNPETEYTETKPVTTISAKPQTSETVSHTTTVKTSTETKLVTTISVKPQTSAADSYTTTATLSETEKYTTTTEDDYTNPFELLDKDFEGYVQKYKFESAEFDIDNDGITEQCTITYGTTSGVFTYIISAYSDGILKYRNTFALINQIVSFKVNDRTAYIRMSGVETDAGYSEYRKIYTEGKNIVIEDMDPVYEWYWGDAEYNPYMY